MSSGYKIPFLYRQAGIQAEIELLDDNPLKSIVPTSTIMRSPTSIAIKKYNKEVPY